MERALKRAAELRSGAGACLGSRATDVEDFLTLAGVFKIGGSGLCSLCGGSGNWVHASPWESGPCLACFGSGIEPGTNGPSAPPSPYMIVGDSWNRPWKPQKFGKTETVELLAGETNFANVAHRLGWFKSISDARKSGWDAPASGSHTVGKRTITIGASDGGP